MCVQNREARGDAQEKRTMEGGFEGPEPILMDLLPASTFSAGGRRGRGSPCSSLPPTLEIVPSGLGSSFSFIGVISPCCPLPSVECRELEKWVGASQGMKGRDGKGLSL